jgi:formylglycine-generating enzyme required for sulfatase activity
MSRLSKLCVCVLMFSAWEEFTFGQDVTSESLVGKKAGAGRDLVLSNEDRAGVDNGTRKELLMVWCPPGKFTMGTPGATDNEAPVEVTLMDGFWIWAWEVTQKEYHIVTGESPWLERGNPQYYKVGDLYPASCVSREEAVQFCSAVTKSERNGGRLPGDWVYTLPTEAQWEYACRAGTETAYSFGDDAAQLVEHGWFDKNAKETGEQYAHEVRQFNRNPWGLYDMHGNVWEWCQEFYSEDAPGGTRLRGGYNPRGLMATAGTPGAFPILRGGAWSDIADGARSAYRFPYRDEAPSTDTIGFRVVLCKPIYNP